jgi:hypothetical protein
MGPDVLESMMVVVLVLDMDPCLAWVVDLVTSKRWEWG